jgi:2-octaprenylphenol hydroxylase
MKKRYDVLIVGAGIVGLTMANLLANSRLQIAVLDKRAPILEWDNQSYDLRVSAITPFSQTVFQDIQIWPAIQNERASAFQKMHVWDAMSDGEIKFESAALGVPTLGYIIENRVMQKALFEKLSQYSNIDFIYSMDIKDIQFDKQLVIAADGANSDVRKLTGVEIEMQSYEHTALVATVRTEKPHQKTAWQRFLPTGPLAFLPLTDPHNCSIVWSTSSQQAASLQQLPEQEFCKQLALNFGYKLGKVECLSARVSFPLYKRHVKNYVQENLAFIGDAAHTIHPLAGQGMNMGIADAKCLADIILQAQAKQRDIGALYTLRPFERARKTENLKLFTVVDNLKKLFANETLSIQSLRGMGLNAINNIHFIKNYLMQCAMEI